MKILVRVAVALVVLVAAGLAALALLAPRIVQSDAVRAKIQSAARNALGRELRYSGLDFGFFPPSLLVVEPAVAGAAPGEPDFATAHQVALRMDIAPLLARVVVIDSVVIEGATLRVVRTKDGFQLPRPGSAPVARPASPSAGAPSEPQGGGAGESPDPTQAPPPTSEAGATPPTAGGAAQDFALAVRGLVLRDATVIIEDRAVSPAVTWEVRDLDVTASGEYLDAPVRFKASGRLGSGGAVRAEGEASLAGDLAVKLVLDAVALAPVTPYLGREAELEGSVGGTLDVSGNVKDPAAVADLDLADANFALDDIRLRGRMSLKADVKSLLEAPSGDFDIDASDAELVYGGAFTKPPGTTATLKGRLVTRDGVIAVDDLKVSIRNLRGEGSARSGKQPRLELTTEPFDVAGWEELVPALAETPLTGKVRAVGLVVTTGPLRVRGDVHLDRLVVPVPDATPVTLTGVIQARGTEIVTRNMMALVAEQETSVDGEVRDVFGEPRYRVRLGADGADMNALTTAIAKKPDFLLGPLAFTGELRGAAGGPTSALESATGDLDFGIAGGRIVGVSLLELVFQQLGGAKGSASALGRIFAGRDLERFYDDVFESLRGEVSVADGVVQPDLDLLYPGYGAHLRGTVSLTDLTIDLDGELVILEDLDRAIARGMGAKQSYKPRQRTVRLTSVIGTIYEPEVQIASNSASELVGAYAETLANDALRDSLGRDGQKIYDIFRGTQN